MNDEELLLCKERVKYGDPDSIIALTNYYLENSDYQRAFLVISRFAYLDHAEGFKKLGYFYEKGYGTPVDDEKAIFYYQKAYEKGDVSAGFNIALLYYKNKKYGDSVAYLVNGRLNNHIPSISLLAELYLKGLGVDKSVEIAINLYYEIIALGECSYYDKVGKIYYQIGEYYKAVEHFNLGAEKLDYDAIYHLAICYSKGQGVPLDIAKAIYYYEIGARNNHPGCIYNLAMHYEKGIGVQQNKEKSQLLLEKYQRLTK